MKQLNSAAGIFGPFASIETLSDRYRCEWADFQFSVIGAATIEDYVAPAHVVTAAERASLLGKIDADTDAIYGAVLGNRGEEYTRAASDAQAYKDAGYTGTVPSPVQSWATAKNWTPTKSADDILATAAQWTGAQAAIRATRLLRKEQVRTAADLAPLSAGWSAFVSSIRTALGVA